MNQVISCSVGYHCGGLGQHFSRVVERARASGDLLRYYAPSIKPGDEAIAERVCSRLAPLLMRWTPVRFSPGWRWHLDCDLFDRKVARLLKPPIECFTGFAGQSLHSFRAAKRRGVKRLELVAGNSHVNNCACQHAKAAALHPIERPWLNDAHRRKSLEEYAMADVIYVASEYSREAFIREGVSPAKVEGIDYPIDPRFTPDVSTSRADDGVFRIVYVGALSVAKGIPLLLEAFERFREGPAELTLVGGSSTRPMRKYLESRLRRDPRMKIAPGDPLPHLRTADVCVHPSWEDNLAYAPLEAMRCGVSVIVTQDTGMKEYVVEGENGYVIPTGDADALLDRLVHLSRQRHTHAVPTT